MNPEGTEPSRLDRAEESFRLDSFKTGEVAIALFAGVVRLLLHFMSDQNGSRKRREAKHARAPTAGTHRLPASARTCDEKVDVTQLFSGFPLYLFYVKIYERLFIPLTVDFDYAKNFDVAAGTSSTSFFLATQTIPVPVRVRVPGTGIHTLQRTS